MRARDCAQEGRILSTLTGSGPVTTALIRIEFFFGGKRDRARVAQMGHPEEGIEGSGTVTEARAEEFNIDIARVVRKVRKWRLTV